MAQIKLSYEWDGNLMTRAIPITKRANERLTWTQYRKLAQLTGEIIFRCGFDKQGKCKGSRDEDGSWLQGPRCCCSGCALSLGYLKKVSKGQANVIRKLWDKATGFWKKGKGCTLPHKYRSPTCLSFLCDSARKRHSVALERVGGLLNVGRVYREKPKEFDAMMKDARARLLKAKLLAPQKKSV